MTVVEKIGKVNHYVASLSVSAAMKTDEYFSKFVTKSMQRFNRGDWGDLEQEDKTYNDKALVTGERILAKYDNTLYKSIYIIADAKTNETTREAVTILFTEEY